ncbi:hypothetical protein BDW22DRAFT_1348938 [Trametopsis cervina]|nr:hypothetical protein BDW22DRAFT_1348938 [Trametopsis cervina]
MERLSPRALANIASMISYNDLLTLHATSSFLWRSCRPLVFAKLRLQGNTAKLEELCEWLEENPGVAQTVMQLHISGRKRRRPYPLNTASPSLTSAEVASVVRLLPCLNRLVLSWLVVPSTSTAWPIAHGVTQFFFHHVDFPTNVLNTLHNFCELNLSIVTLDCVRLLLDSPVYHQLSFATKTLHVILSAQGENLGNIIAVRGIETLICENITPGNVDWFAHVVAENCATLRCLKLVEASHKSAFTAVWPKLPFASCHGLQVMTIGMPLNVWDDRTDSRSIAESLSVLIAGLPSTLSSLSIELDCRGWYGVPSYASIIEKIPWKGVLEAIAGLPGLRELQSCTRIVTGDGFNTVRRILLTHPRLSNAIRQLQVQGNIGGECGTSPIVRWRDLVRLLQVTPAMQHLNINGHYIKSSGPFPMHTAFPISLHISNSTFDRLSPSLGILLQTISLEELCLTNVRLPPSTNWISGYLGVPNVVMTWMRPLQLDEVQAVPIFSSTTQLASFNMTDDSHIMFLLPMDFWFGQDDYYRRQRGLIKFISQLPASTTHFILEMSYYAWAKYETQPHTPFSTGMRWNELDDALSHVPNLECLTIQWFAQEETAELLHGTLPDTGERHMYTVGYHALLSGLQYALRGDDVAVKHLNTLLETVRGESTSESEDKGFLAEVMSAMVKLVAHDGAQQAVLTRNKTREVLRGVVVKWMHTAWLHETREEFHAKHDYDLFEDLVFDLDMVVDKLWAQMKEKQIDIDTFDRQHARVQKVYDAIPPEKRAIKPTIDSTTSQKAAGSDKGLKGRKANVRGAKGTTAGTVPAPNKTFDVVYEKYPKYLKDTFSKADLLRTFPHENTWPKPPYDKHLRSKGHKMGRPTCVQCYIDNADCMTTLTHLPTSASVEEIRLPHDDHDLLTHVGNAGNDRVVKYNRTQQSTTPAITDNHDLPTLSQLPRAAGEDLETQDLVDAVQRERRSLRAQLAVQTWLLDDLEDNEEGSSDAA